MKKERNEIDRLTEQLLKKSMLKPEHEDFNELLMQKILDLPAPVQANGSLFKNGWRYLILSLILLIASIVIISYLSEGAYAEIGKYLVATKMYILYGGMALFVPLLFTQLDTLLKLMFDNRYQTRVNY
jgi:hypothetical protein